MIFIIVWKSLLANLMKSIKEHRNIDKNDDPRHKDMKRMVDSSITKLSL